MSAASLPTSLLLIASGSTRGEVPPVGHTSVDRSPAGSRMGWTRKIARGGVYPAVSSEGKRKPQEDGHACRAPESNAEPGAARASRVRRPRRTPSRDRTAIRHPPSGSVFNRPFSHSLNCRVPMTLAEVVWPRRALNPLRAARRAPSRRPPPEFEEDDEE